MKPYLDFHSKGRAVSIHASDDGRTISIWMGEYVGDLKCVAEFDICMLWDHIRDTIAVADVGYATNPSLFRRKLEALGAIGTGMKFMVFGLKEEWDALQPDK